MAYTRKNYHVLDGDTVVSKHNGLPQAKKAVRPGQHIGAERRPARASKSKYSHKWDHEGKLIQEDSDFSAAEIALNLIEGGE